MNLAEFRKSLGLSQEECAAALGLRSKSHICGIEKGARDASPELALKIERWSNGRVQAASLSGKVRDVAGVRPVKRRRSR